MGIQKTIAKFIQEDALTLIDEQHLERAKLHILDTVGVALAGHSDYIASILLNYTKETENYGESTILGSTRKTSLSNAALVNGILAHALDYDDSSWRLIGHPSAVVLPAILAVAEKLDVSGREFLTAYLIGVEVSCKIGVTASPGLYQSGWHATSVGGVIGATAGVSYLLKLSEEEIIYALGISASSACGLRSNFGSMTKPYHAGIAAQNGLQATYLAKNGLTSSTKALEGKMGYFENFSKRGVGISLNEHLGKPFDILNPGFYVKAYPSCAATHTAIDALLSMIKDPNHDIRNENVKKIRVGSGPVGPLMLIHNRPKEGAQGKFSMPFVMASCLHDGDISIDTFTDERVQSLEIIETMRKVEFFVHEQFKTYPINEAPAFVEIELFNGDKLSKRIEKPLGSPLLPLNKNDFIKKYRDCSSRILPDEKVNKSIKLLLELEKEPNMKAVIETLQLVDVSTKC
jgi:2-methylcitrate dehydratase PrpD